MNSVGRMARVFWVALRALAVLTVIVIVYSFVVTGLGQAIFPHQANGSLIEDGAGRVVGSALIGQSFTGADGQPLPQYFQPRPSAGGYDPRHSGGTGLGPDNPDLAAAIAQRRADIAAFNGVAPEDVPPDAVTASGSGLDPDISLAYATIQIHRVAVARGRSDDWVAGFVTACTRGRSLGVLGEPRVNVVLLNFDLDQGIH